MSVCHGGVDDETCIRSHVLCDVWLVDWRAAQCEERGVGRDRDWELTAGGNDWRTFLVVLIAPGWMCEPGRRRRGGNVYSPCLLPQRRTHKPGNNQKEQYLTLSHCSNTQRRGTQWRRVRFVVDSITKAKVTIAGVSEKKNPPTSPPDRVTKSNDSPFGTFVVSSNPP